MKKFIEENIITLILGTSSILLAIWFNSTDSIQIRFWILVITLTSIIPVAVKYILFNVSKRNTKEFKESKTNNKKLKDYHTNYNKVKETKGNYNSSYEILRDSIKVLVQNSEINRRNLLIFKKELCNRVNKEYYKNYKFENDMHEIYVKLKDENLTKEDYDNMMQLLLTLKN